MQRVRNVLMLGLAAVLPQELRAQTPPSGYQPGSYYLAAAPAQPHQGQLLVLNNTLTAVAGPGDVRRYQAQDLAYVRLADRTRYQSVGSFVANGKLKPIKPTLVEVLDSGQVMLLVYMQPVMKSAGITPTGGLMSSSGVQPVYLLQRATEPQPVALPDAGMSRGGKSFREALAPYVARRPDLAKLLADKEIVTDNLPYFIHALNTGRPFDDAASAP
jgi:hypothetical protein